MRAAAPEPDARLDAAQLAARLSSVAATLPPPEPLALANGSGGPSRTVPGFTPGVAEATSVIDNPLTRTAMATSSSTVVAPMIPAGGPGETFEEMGPGVPIVRRRRRRWPILLGVLVVVLGVVGLIIGLLTSGAFTPTHPVPNLVGSTLAQAERAAAHDHFTLVQGAPVTSITQKPGDIVSQSPGQNTTLSQGSTVHIVVSKGLPIESVPSLLSLNCTAAVRLLNEAHFQGICPAAAEGYSATVPTGNVINWSYNNVLDTNARALRGDHRDCHLQGPGPGDHRHLHRGHLPAGVPAPSRPSA